MEPTPLPILFTHYGDDWIRGSETALLDLLAALDKRVVHPVVWCNGRALAAASREAGYDTLQGVFQHALDYASPRPSLRTWWALVRTGRAQCRQHGIRILHVNSAAPAQWLVPVGLAERLPVLVHLHAPYLRRSRYVSLLHAATLSVGVSAAVTAGLASDGMATDRIRTIPNGIDPARLRNSGLDLRARCGIPPEAFVVGAVGSLISRKGHDVLLRAVASLPVTSHLVVLGDGPERPRLVTLAASLGSAARMHFAGYSDNVVALYQAADVVALSSRSEAFGLVLLEAGYFGLPVVASAVGGVPEVVVAEETGLLVPPDDPVALAAALSRLARDPDLRRRLGEAARERVLRSFTATRMAREFEAAYQGLAALPRQALGWSALAGRLRPYAKLLAGPQSRAAGL